MTRFLGLDSGGTATRWSLCDAQGKQVAAGELQPTSGHLFNPEERARFEAMVAALRNRIDEGVAGVIAGMTGLSTGAPEADTAVALLAAAFAIPAKAVQVHDDIWTAYHSAFRPGEGHVVYSGTGSVAIHIRSNGEVIRVGGRGILIDDAGSAFWIGQQALNMIWRRIDDNPAATSPLADAVFAAIGSADWNAVRSHVYGGGRSAVAALARAVAGADDPDARDLFRRAGAELARMAMALVHRAGPRPVALLGRAATLHPAIADGFRAAAPAIEMHFADNDAALAAARLAAGLFESGHLAATGAAAQDSAIPRGK